MVVGNYLGKMRSDFFFGIRTPSTLSSELSWNRTHRLGGKLMIALGALVAAAAAFPTVLVWLAVLLAGTAFLVAVVFVYSYRLWRDDPARQRLSPW